MLPGGGYVVALAEVYIDESYDDAQPPILCLAGYIFKKHEAREFSRKWAAYLERKGLPYFHMSEAAAAKQGVGIFANKPELALEVERELIRRTKAATEIGLAMTINEDDYAEHMRPRDGMRSAYAAALLMIMTQVRKWAERTHFTGEIAYFFEAGHKHKNDANVFMNWLFSSQRIAAKFRYAGHDFVPKRTPGLHPADLLAWQWRLEKKRQLDPNRRYPARKDLIALVRDQDLVMDWSRDDVAAVGEGMRVAEFRREARVNEALLTGILPEGFGEN